MFEGVPLAVQEKLEYALQRIEGILTETNAALAELAEPGGDPAWPDDYALIGATIYYNDPDVDLVFRYATRILPDPSEAVAENSENAVDHPDDGANMKVQYRSATAPCNYGYCCDAAPGKSCKRVPSPGDPNRLKCGRNPQC